MNAIRNKLKSNTGASITFALLAFVVCAIVSIVVIVAGSAAAGRMSQRAEIDQRYYAVSSAVELLCDLFNEKTVEVEYQKLTEADEVDIDGLFVPATGERIVDDASKYLVYMIANGINTNSEEISYSLTTSLDPGDPEAPGDNKYALACDIKEHLFRDGRLVFEVSNAGTERTAKYTLRATFTATISETVSEFLNDEGKPMQDVKTTIQWKLNGITKGITTA